MNNLTVIYDLASGFWTGKPWLVIREEGTTAVASFRTDGEAFDFIADEEPASQVAPASAQEPASPDTPP
jgi:hypothetical protein